MTDREKAINGLKCCLPMTTRSGLGDCRNCPYDREITLEGGISECCHELMLEAIALLKAQEPRVLTLAEYKALAEKPKEERDPVWEEWPGLESTWAIPNQAYGGYGTSWRVWTSRPTDEQREATSWNE